MHKVLRAWAFLLVFEFNIELLCSRKMSYLYTLLSKKFYAELLVFAGRGSLF